MSTAAYTFVCHVPVYSTYLLTYLLNDMQILLGVFGSLMHAQGCQDGWICAIKACAAALR